MVNQDMLFSALSWHTIIDVDPINIIIKLSRISVLKQ